MSRVYSTYEFYSPILDSAAVRISVPDGRGGEFFAIVSRPAPGKSWREVRDRALNAIESAMESGLDPGEVEVRQ